MSSIIASHWLPLTVVIFIAVLLVLFYRRYLRPARQLNVDLQRAINGLKSAKANSNNGIIHTEQVLHSFLHNKDLLHLWNEYTETVHEQYAFVNNQKQLVALRATVPAETFFNTAVIVDTKLNTEFFKHLPGILTGIGIIATFTGLFIGLNHFTPDTSNIELLSSGLKELMSGVQEAFAASGIAIFFAMLITFLEKNQLNERYKQVEELAQEVDALYNAGAGEEYLRELVDSSLQNQSHTAQLKDAMVNDLKTMLENLGTTIAAGFNKTMQEQMEQLLRGQEETNKELVVAIQEGMKEPLDKVEKAITKLAGKQEEGVGELIGVAVDKIENMFGSKLTEFGELLNKATHSLNESMLQINTAASNMQHAGDRMFEAGGAIELSGRHTADAIKEAGTDFTFTSLKLVNAADEASKAAESMAVIMNTASIVADKLSGVQNSLESLDVSVNQLKNGFEQTQSTYQESSNLLRDQVGHVGSVLEKMKLSIADFDIVSNAMQSAGIGIDAASKELKLVVDQFGSTKSAVSGASNMIGDVSQSLLTVVDKLSSMTSGAQQAADSLSGVSHTFEALKDISEALKQNANQSGHLHEQNMVNVSEMLGKLNDSVTLINNSSVQMGDKLEAILTEVKDLATGVNQSVNSIKSILVEGADRINLAGENLKSASLTASNHITSAGSSLSTNLEGSAADILKAAQEFNQSATNWKTISSDIKSASELLEGATSGLQNAAGTVNEYLTQYEQQNKNVSNLIVQVSDLVTQAQYRGELGQQHVDQMKTLVAQMQQAQQEAAKFGEQVGAALAQGYSSFAIETKQAITKVTHDHQMALNDAVKIIRDNVSELDEALNKLVQVANART